MLAKLLDSASRPSVCTADLEGAGPVDRRLVEHARGDLDVLPLQRRGHVGRGHAERLQALGIEPDPHRVVAAAEHGDRADAVDARERILDLEHGIVGDEQVSRDLSGDNRCTTIIRSDDALATVTPMLRTSAGRRGSAVATRFCTCTCAISRLVPTSKVTPIENRPSPLEFDDT